MKNECVVPQNNRIEYIDIIRGFAIILMIMGHVDFSEGFDKYIHIFHMPIWFFVSGWLYKKTVSVKYVIIKKAQSLLISYVVFGILQYPVWFMLNRAAEDLLEPLRNLFWINTNLVMPIAGALWFLTCLFFAELIFTVIMQFVKSEYIRCIFVIIIAVAGNLIAMYDIRLPWAIDVSFVAVGFIYAGYMLKKMSVGCCKKWFELPVPIIIILFFGNLVAANLNSYVNLRTGEYGIILLFWINALLAIIIYWNIAKKIDAWKHSGSNVIISYVREIGRNSIVYLVLNQFFITVLNRVCYKLVNIEAVNSFPVRVIVLIITLIGLKFMCWFITNTKLKVVIGK